MSAPSKPRKRRKRRKRRARPAPAVRPPESTIFLAHLLSWVNERLPLADCKACGGRGGTECRSCEGDGEHRCYSDEGCNDIHECGACDGAGLKPCKLSRAKGDGKCESKPAPAFVWLGHMLVDAWDLRESLLLCPHHTVGRLAFEWSYLTIELGMSRPRLGEEPILERFMLEDLKHRPDDEGSIAPAYPIGQTVLPLGGAT